MRKKYLQYILDHHDYKIWQGKNGRWLTYISDEESPGGRKQISRSSREVLDDFLYDLYSRQEEKIKLQKLTMESFYTEWVDYKKGFVSDASIARYNFTWNAYYKDSEIIKIPMKDLTKQEVESWMLETIRRDKMNAHQFESFAVIIRQMFEYASDIDLIETNVTKKVKLPLNRILVPEIKKPSETQVFFHDERARLIDYALAQFRKHRDKTQRYTSLAIAFLLFVPLRRGELVALRFEDLRGRQIVLKDTFDRTTNELKGRLKDARG